MTHGLKILGILTSFDEYMNLRLKNCVLNEQALNDVVIRCNNIIYI